MVERLFSERGRGCRSDLVPREEPEDEVEIVPRREDASSDATESKSQLFGQRSRAARRLAFLTAAVLALLALASGVVGERGQGMQGSDTGAADTLYEQLKVNLCKQTDGWASFVTIFDCPNKLPCAGPGADCTKPKCCKQDGKVCYTKTSFYAACRSHCTKGFIDPNDPDGRAWECKPLSKVPKGHGNETETETENETETETETTPAPPKFGPGCSSSGADCRQTKCCQKRSLQCYEKNDYFATCKPSCKPGMDAWGGDWSCKNLGEESQGSAAGDHATQALDSLSCSKAGVDCRKTKCCQDSNSRCYEKNEYFASCKTSCIPGHIDHIGGKWSCKDITAQAQATAKFQ